MLNKCVTTNATLLVPDIEDSVPYDQKPEARAMIRQKLPWLREQTQHKKVALFPRTNAPALEDGSLFFQDVTGVISKETKDMLDGICVPKVDTLHDLRRVETALLDVEKALGLKPYHYKVIP